MTDDLFRQDATMRSCDAQVIAINARGGIVLDRTVFYGAGGGQPGDQGTLSWSDAKGEAMSCAIGTTVYDEDRTTLVHVPADEGASLPVVGTSVQAQLDWDLRYQHMRVHTALHLLCSLVPFPVTGGQIKAGEGRLDFDIQDANALDKSDLTDALMELVAANHPVSQKWITDDELTDNPGLVRTMSVKPPMGSGRVRLIAIGVDGAIDLQPCGGTHVASTGEIGALAVTKIEKKGKQNRRVRVVLQD